MSAFEDKLQANSFKCELCGRVLKKQTILSLSDSEAPLLALPPTSGPAHVQRTTEAVWLTELLALDPQQQMGPGIPTALLGETPGPPRKK